MSSSNDYAQVSQEVLSAVKGLIADTDGWTTVTDHSGVLLESKPREGSYINCYRLTGSVKASPKDAVDRLWSWAKPDWQKFTPDLQDFEIVENLSPTSRIVYQRSSLPWPLWHRDVCLLSTKVEEDGTHYVLFKSVQHEKVPEKPTEYVRANVLISCYAFSPDGTGSKLTRVVHLEPNGSIPSSIVNMKAGEQHGAFLSLAAMFEQ